MKKKHPDQVVEDEVQTESTEPVEAQGTEPVAVSEEQPENMELDYQAKSEEYLNDLKRLQADFDNYKKRQAEAEKSLRGYLIEGLVLDLIPVLDNFHAATMHVPEAEKTSPWVVGIQYIEKQLETVLKENGVTMLEPVLGEPFNPKLHEAIESEATDEEMTNTVAQVKQKGYQLGDRIIRAAKVTVK